MAASARRRTWRASCSTAEAGTQADAGRLSGHGPGDERSGRRSCRFLLRAGGERGRAGAVRHHQGVRRVGHRLGFASLPEVPAAKDGGVNYQMSVWAGIFAPKGTPKDVVEKLPVALDKALDDPTVIKRLADLGGAVPKKAERAPRRRFEKLVKSEIVALEADPEDGRCPTSN